MKRFLAVISVFSSLITSSESNAKSNLCEDSVQAVCESQSSPVQKITLAKNLMKRAATQTQNFLGDSVQAPNDFLYEVLMTVKNAQVSDQALSAGVTRAVTYLSCLDYLARGYFNSQNDYGYLSLNCFPAGPANGSVAKVRTALERLGDLTQHQKTLNAFNQIKEHTLQVVRESTYSADLKPALLAAVASTQYFSMKDYVDEALETVQNDLSKDPKGRAKLPGGVLQILTQCDPTAQRENAFNYATTLTSLIGSVTLHRMVICPSMWIYGTRVEYKQIGSDQVYDRHAIQRDHTYVKPPVITTPQMEGSPDSLVFVVAHELGHSVDVTILNEVMTIDSKKPLSLSQKMAKANMSAFTSCLKRRHSDHGTLTANLLGAIDLDASLSADLFFNEYHADSVAANVMSLYLKKYPSMSMRHQAVKSGLKMFCGGVNHDVMTNPGQRVLHPAGEFRIETAFVGNAQLRKTLGCQSKPKVFGCSFR